MDERATKVGMKLDRGWGESEPSQRARLGVAKQPLQRLNANVPLSMPSSASADAASATSVEWRQPLLNEPLKPAQRRPFVARRIDVRQQLTQRERVGKREPTHLPGGHFGG
jgi:hypothetical protein